MENQKSVKNEKQATRQIVLDAIVIEQSKLELFVALQNILEYYQQLYNEIVDSETISETVLESLNKCHEKLKALYSAKRKLLKDDIKSLLKEFLIESDQISKAIASIPEKNITEIKKLLSTKKYTVEYKILSLKSNLYITSKPQSFE